MATNIPQSAHAPSINLLDDMHKQYPRDKYNYLFPTETLMQISPLQQITYEQVRIDPKPLPVGQDVYKVGTEKIGDGYVTKLAFAKPAFQRLATAAGIILNTAESGFVATGNPRKVMYKCVGGMRLPGGEPILKSATKSINLDTFVEKTRIKLMAQWQDGKLIEKWVWDENARKNKPVYVKANAPNGEQIVAKQVRDEELRMMEHMEAMAESKAFNRLVQSLLGLKPWFTEEELNKPFIVVKVSTNIAFLLADPETKAMATQFALRASFEMFGATPAAHQLTAGHQTGESKQIPADLMAHDAPQIQEVVEDTEEEVSLQETLPLEAAEEVIPELASASEDTPLLDMLKMFKAASHGDRIECVKHWITLKGYTPKDGNPAPEEMNDEELAMFIEYLHQLKKKPQARKINF